MTKKIYLFGFVLLIFALPSPASALILNLNGEGGVNQTFANDTNVGITSASNVHTLSWNGLLSAVRGGTGVDLSTFTPGSLLFWDGSEIAENSDVFALEEDVVPYTGAMSDLDLGGNNLNFSTGGGLFFTTSGVQLQSSVADEITVAGSSISTLDLSAVTTDQTFRFPNSSGIFSLLESNQEFSGINTFSNPVNNFISDTNNTVHIGADGIPGCIALGDNDGSGVTYITANDGVLLASSTPPSNCN